MNASKAISIGIIIFVTSIMVLLDLLNPTKNHLDLLLYVGVGLFLIAGVSNASEYGIFAD